MRKSLSHALCSHPPQTGEIRQLNVVVVRQRKGNKQKCVMHVQRCCFGNLIYCFFRNIFVVVLSSLKILRKERPTMYGPLSF